MNRPQLLTILLILPLVAACGCRIKAAEQPDDAPTVERSGNQVVVPERSPLRGRIKVAPVKAHPVQSHLVTPATVEANPSHLAKIAPPVPGRVVKLFVSFGDEVKDGQPLLALDSPDLATAQSEFLRARGALAQAERTLGRQKDLTQHGIGAQREVEQAQTEYQAAKSELERATMRLKVLGIDPGKLGKPLVVRSPIAGRVTELSVAPGEFRNDLSAVLMVVADLSTVWVTASVQEKDIRRVHKGDAASATFASYPGEAFKGNVLFVGDLLDPETRTIKVRIAFANGDGKLKPGMFASATFTGAPVNEIVVPTKALVLIGDKSYVYVEKAAWRFERRAVEPGEQQGDITVIGRGLVPDERIVVEDSVLLQ